MEGVVDGLILFSHGSVLCGAGEALEEHARRLQETGEWAAVEIGYLNYSRPRFADSVAKLGSLGIHRITILPYFLVPGKFVGRDLPRAIAAAESQYPDLQFTIAEPIGFDPLLADAILELAEKAEGPESWGRDLEQAAKRCEQNPRCPLFGTENCPTPTVARIHEAIR